MVSVLVRLSTYIISMVVVGTLVTSLDNVLLVRLVTSLLVTR